MCHLKALQKKGLIHREPNMSRAIQMLDEPTGAQPSRLKLVGRIAAGQPIEAVEQDEELGFSEWEGADDKFALRVSGDSMIEDTSPTAITSSSSARKWPATARSSPCATTTARRP
jgi:repressor LexA